jgi:hypothetical protein
MRRPLDVKRNVNWVAPQSRSPTNGRAVGVAQPFYVPLDFSQPLLIPPFDLAVIGRREGGCQGSRGGRLAQPLTTFFPERSSSQVEWRVLLLALGCRVWRGCRRQASIRTLKESLVWTRCTLVSETFRCCNLPDGLRWRLLCHHDQPRSRSHRGCNGESLLGPRSDPSGSKLG